MYKISKSFKFEASHILPYHNGKCSRLHGHSWIFIVNCISNELIDFGNDTGMIIDYEKISEIVNPIIEQYLDHYHLNDTLDLISPTSEEIAKWLFYKIKPKLDLLYSIEICETCTTKCEYTDVLYK